MKNLHFYIQCVMLLAALAIAVQLPLRSDLFGYLMMIQLILGSYQLVMSWMLKTKLSETSRMLDTHFFISLIYLFVIITLGVSGPEWMGDWWTFALYVFPWGIAVFFLVTIDELERERGYRL